MLNVLGPLGSNGWFRGSNESLRDLLNRERRDTALRCCLRLAPCGILETSLSNIALLKRVGMYALMSAFVRSYTANVAHLIIKKRVSAQQRAGSLFSWALHGGHGNLVDRNGALILDPFLSPSAVLSKLINAGRIDFRRNFRCAMHARFHLWLI